MIIGHRGASGYLPEHTLAAYELAVRMGGDAVETDVVMTRDGRLVCRHDCELSLTTDAADRRELASKETSAVVDGVEQTGWFVHDFTLDEVRMLKCRERFPFRSYDEDDLHAVCSLEELLTAMATRKTIDGRRVRVIIEIKHAAFFQSLGLDVAAAIERTLREFDLASADSPVAIESFESDILQRLHKRIDTPIIQLIDAEERAPADVAAAKGGIRFDELITPAGLAQVARYATRIGVWKRLILPATEEQAATGGTRLGPPTSLIADAHAAGLLVDAWTFRSEGQFLADDYEGDPMREYAQFGALGVDGIITDFPDVAREALVENE